MSTIHTGFEEVKTSHTYVETNVHFCINTGKHKDDLDVFVVEFPIVSDGKDAGIKLHSIGFSNPILLLQRLLKQVDGNTRWCFLVR